MKPQHSAQHNFVIRTRTTGSSPAERFYDQDLLGGRSHTDRLLRGEKVSSIKLLVLQDSDGSVGSWLERF